MAEYRQIINQLTNIGVQLSVTDGKLKIHLPWQKENIPPEALSCLKQAKVIQNKLLEILFWDKDRAIEEFKSAILRASQQFNSGVIKLEDLNREMSSLGKAEKRFNSAVSAENMQLVISAVQEWETVIRRCTDVNRYPKSDTNNI